MQFGINLKREFKTALSIIKFDIYRLFNKKKIEKSKQDVILMCSAQIGQAVIHQLAAERSFRRVLTLKYPHLEHIIDSNISIINNATDEQ